MQGQAETGRELTVKMEFRVGGDAAQNLQLQIIVQMPVDMVQHPLHPGLILSKRRRHGSSSVAVPSNPKRWWMCSTDLAVVAGAALLHQRTMASSMAKRPTFHAMRR